MDEYDEGSCDMHDLDWDYEGSVVSDDGLGEFYSAQGCSYCGNWQCSGCGGAM